MGDQNHVRYRQLAIDATARYQDFALSLMNEADDLSTKVVCGKFMTELYISNESLRNSAFVGGRNGPEVGTLLRVLERLTTVCEQVGGACCS